MRQFQFAVNDQSNLSGEIKKIRQWCQENKASGVLFQVYTEMLDRDRFEAIFQTIDKEMPDAEYVGCSSNGNIVNGDFSGESIAVVCTVFEHPTTQIEVLQYPLSGKTQRFVADRLIDEVNRRPWVKAVEMFVTIRGMSMTGLCDYLKEVREDVAIFGGGAFSDDINEDTACVYSKAGGYAEKSIVFVLFGGDVFHIHTQFITGWKPLGKVLEVTKAEGPILKELDYRPAYETYYRYLHIRNDKDFFNNTLEFPFIYQTHGIEILRAPIASNPDGSLTMTADMEVNVKARIAYGDPWTILESVRKSSETIRQFAPEAIFVFSCAGRRTFWGNQNIGKETLPLQRIAPTSGFYTSGEFVRTNGYVNQHNVSLVIAAMREGEAPKTISHLSEWKENEDGKVSMIGRLASFINATTEELTEANKRLAAMAITDGLTGLYNRAEIQRRIIETVDDKHESGTFLIMLDVDDFKQVNDTYGHEAGDRVLIRLSKFLYTYQKNSCAVVGRWGGEEFMVMITKATTEEALDLAESIRDGFESIGFGEIGHKTLSVGVTGYAEGEDADLMCSRVDDALYQAKRTGKNKVVYFER